MDINTFYAVTAATSFTLVGLWWSVVKDKPEWFKDERSSRMASGVYSSFLIPALMSLGAQVGGDSRVIWKGVFIFAALAGIIFSTKLIKLTRLTSPNGPFSKNSWVVPILYFVVLIFAIFPGFAGLLGLQPLQVEGMLLCLLILCGHLMSWEFISASARNS